MEKLSARALQQLTETDASPSATLYIPLHVTASPPHITENQIRLKNLIHATAKQLRAKGQAASNKLADTLEQFLQERYDDLAFWEAQTAGLLICANPHSITMYQLPIDTEEYAAVDNHFHLAPILGLVADNHPFYVLALAQHNPILYKGDMYGLEPAEIDLPANIKDALNIDENNQKGESQGTATGPSGDTGWFNGRGGARNPQEEDRLRFFRLIDKALCTDADTSLPLLLAGIEAEMAEYRHLSKYPKIMKHSVPGNHEADTLAQLFAKADQIVRQELVAPAHRDAIEEYNRVSGANPGRTADNEAHILQAVEAGRVDKLLTSFSRDTTDTVRDQAGSVIRLTFPTAKQSRTINDIALKAWRMSGKVINLLPSEMPGNKLMVARLRY